MGLNNHRLHEPEASAGILVDGRSNMVRKTSGPIRAAPWSPYIAGNDKKVDLPDLR